MLLEDLTELEGRVLLVDLIVLDLEDLVVGRVTLVLDLDVLLVPTLRLVLDDLPTRVLLELLDVAALDKRLVE